MLTHTGEDLSVDLQRPSQSSEFRPSAEEAETGRFLELHRQVAWPNSCSSGSVRDPVSKTRKENDESPQAYTHIQEEERRRRGRKDGRRETRVETQGTVWRLF